MKEINWTLDKELCYYGKKGTGKCTGITFTNDGDNFKVNAKNTRGTTGNCFIEIPKDSIKEIINTLKSLI